VITAGVKINIAVYENLMKGTWQVQGKSRIKKKFNKKVFKVEKTHQASGA